MNGRAAEILSCAAVFRGELHKMLLAAGIVLLILFIAWAIQEWHMRGSANALSWIGVTCLGLIGFGACALLIVGLL